MRNAPSPPRQTTTPSFARPPEFALLHGWAGQTSAPTTVAQYAYAVNKGLVDCATNHARIIAACPILEVHRPLAAAAACHAKIPPAHAGQAEVWSAVAKYLSQLRASFLMGHPPPQTPGYSFSPAMLRSALLEDVLAGDEGLLGRERQAVNGGVNEGTGDGTSRSGKSDRGVRPYAVSLPAARTPTSVSSAAARSPGASNERSKVPRKPSRLPSVVTCTPAARRRWTLVCSGGSPARTLRGWIRRPPRPRTRPSRRTRPRPIRSSVARRRGRRALRRRGKSDEEAVDARGRYVRARALAHPSRRGCQRRRRRGAAPGRHRRPGAGRVQASMRPRGFGAAPRGRRPANRRSAARRFTSRRYVRVERGSSV